MNSLEAILAAEKQATKEKQKLDEIWQFIQKEKKKQLRLITGTSTSEKASSLDNY